MTRVTGPRDGNIALASFFSKTNSKSNFSSLKETKDLVLLSITGNEFCSGKYLGAIIDEAVKSHQTTKQGDDNKGLTTILIADEIYWHNLKVLENTASEEVELKRRALALGEEYFKKNLEYFIKPLLPALGISFQQFQDKYPYTDMDAQINIINFLAIQLGLNYEIMRWKNWVAKDSAGQLQKIQPLYQSDPALKLAMDKSIKGYAERAVKNGESLQLLEHRSRGYLTEESPAIMWLSAFLGYNFIVYPGEILPSFQATREYFVLKNHEPYVSQGRSYPDDCTHDKCFIHVDNPVRTANWLDVCFKMRFSDNQRVIKPSGLGLFAYASGASENRANSYANSVKLFPKQGDGGALSRDANSDINRQHRISDDKILRSVIYGLELGAAQQKGTPLDPKTLLRLSPNQDLTKVVQGVTEGILESQLPDEEKYNILFKLIDRFAVPNTPRPTVINNLEYPVEASSNMLP